MRRIRSFTGLVACLFVLAIAFPASAGAGDLDPTFGESGVAVPDDSGDGAESAHDVVVLPNGRLFAVGNIAFETAGPFATIDLLSPSGEPLPVAGDSSPLASFDATSFRAAAVTPDGAIVVAGWAGMLTDTGALIRSRFLVARFLPSGAYDTTFSGDGVVVTQMGWADADANDLMVRRDGRIVVVGDAVRRNGVVAIARFRSNGSLDGSFGTAGRAFVSAPGGLWEARAAAIDTNGGVLVAANRSIELTGGERRPTFAVARLRANGGLETTFGNAGVATVAFGPRSAVVSDLVVRPDGRIVVGGTASASDQAGEHRFALARLMPSGRIDLSFDTDGRVLTRLPEGGGSLGGLVRQTDGKLVAGGWDDTRAFALARYRPNGALDPTFGVGGIVRVGTLTDAGIEALALQRDGRIVAAGFADGVESIYTTPAYARVLP